MWSVEALALSWSIYFWDQAQTHSVRLLLMEDSEKTLGSIFDQWADASEISFWCRKKHICNQAGC